MKKLMLAVVIGLVVLFVGIQAVSARFPDQVRVIMAASADCEFTAEQKARYSTWEITLAKIWRWEETTFGRDELLDDGTLAVGALLTAYQSPEDTCKTSASRLLRAYVDGGMDINRLGGDPEGKWKLTALHEAVGSGHSDSVRLLLEHGADPTIGMEMPGMPGDGMTALQLAKGLEAKVRPGDAGMLEIISMLKDWELTGG